MTTRKIQPDQPLAEQPVAEHPLAVLQQRGRFAAAVGGGCVMLAAVWAFWPQGDPAVSVAPLLDRPAQIASAKASVPLDLAAFSSPVWDAPPVPPKPVVVAEKPPPPPPPPLKLQLLGIVRDEFPSPDGSPVYMAAIYDEAADKLLMLRAGDSLGASGSGRIARVHADAVELTDPSGTRRLALHQPIVPIPGLLAPARGKP